VEVNDWILGTSSSRKAWSTLDKTPQGSGHDPKPTGVQAVFEQCS